MIEKSLEAQVLKSDNSSLARDCRRDMQQLNRCATQKRCWLSTLQLLLLPGCKGPLVAGAADRADRTSTNGRASHMCWAGL